MFSKPIIFLTLLVSGAVSLHGQAFMNLNFESASLSSVPANQLGGFVPIGSALPGWTAFLSGPSGTIQQTRVLQNNYYNSTAVVDIFGPTWSLANQNNSGGLGVLDGKYTVALQSGAYDAPGYSTSIAQTGTVPLGTQSLQFISSEVFSATFSGLVSFAGNELPVVPLSSGISASGIPYEKYGVNIAPYAGETGQLEFTSLYTEADPSLLLDDISFSTNAVPEPDPVVLTAIGGMALFLWRRFRN